MITKAYSAPIGTGLRKRLVVPDALCQINAGRAVTVITAGPCMTEQFKRDLPQASYIGPMAWLNRASDRQNDLIIVDELPATLLRHIKSTLEYLKTEVWLVNPHVDF